MIRKLIKYIDKNYFGNRIAIYIIQSRLANKRLERKPYHIAYDKFLVDVYKLRASDSVIDCGSNVGSITNIFARSGATVYAFDPEPTVKSSMEEIAKNFRNVKFFPVAVGVLDDIVHLYRPHDFLDDPVLKSQSVSVLSSKLNVSGNSIVEVKQINLLKFIESVGKIKILKLDVEGAEVSILRSIMESNIIDSIDKIYVELHDHSLPELSADYRWIRDIVADRFSDKIIVDWG